MRHADAEICHRRAWACLREANQDEDEARRAMLAAAAFTWETLATEIDVAADRAIEPANPSPVADDDWLRAEIANAWAVRLAGRH